MSVRAFGLVFVVGSVTLKGLNRDRSHEPWEVAVELVGLRFLMADLQTLDRPAFDSDSPLVDVEVAGFQIYGVGLHVVGAHSV